jgi:hypothetical protein
MMINDWNPSTIEILPANTYLVEITAWKREKSKTGNDMIRFDGRVVKPANFEGKSLVDYITITETAIWRLKAFIANALNLASNGVKLPKMDTNSSEFENILNACKGRKMFWTVIVDTYDGKEKNKTAQKDPYGEWAKNAPFSVESIEDVPDWVKSDKE